MTNPFRAISIAAVGLILTTACGSTTSTTTGSAAASATAACMQQAQAVVTTAKAPMVPNIPTTPINMAANKGKSVWFISPSQTVPFAQQISVGFAAAAKAAGLKPVVFDGAGSVNTWNQGVATAVSQHAAGIVLQAIDPAVLTVPLAAAKAAGIPVIDSFNGTPSDPLGSLYAHVTTDFTKEADWMAAYALVQTKCNSDIAEFSQPAYLIWAEISAEIQKFVNRLCPTCKLSITQTDFTKVATVAGPQLVTLITRDPKTNFVLTFDYPAPFMVTAETAAGDHVPILGHDGVPQNLDLIRQGTSQVGTVSDAPLPSIGWAQIDELGRAMLGMAPADDSVPAQLLDKSNLAATDDTTQLFPGFSGYEAKYLSAWGLSS